MGWHTSTILKHIANNPKTTPHARERAFRICQWLGRGGWAGSFRGLHSVWYESLPEAAGLPTPLTSYGLSSRHPNDPWRPTHDALVAYAREHEIPEDWDPAGGR